MNNDSHPARDKVDGPPELHVDSAAAPDRPTGRNLGQKLARASWWACFVAIILNFGMSLLSAPTASKASGVVIAVLVLLGAALLLAIIALLGVRRWGSEDVVRPATVGLLLSLAMIGLMGNAVISQRNAARDREKLAADQQRQFEQQMREALFASGWLGLQPADRVLLTISSIPKDHPIAASVLSKVNTELSTALVLVQNHGSTAATIDTGGAVATLRDGTRRTALDAAKILEGATSDREALLRAYTPPLTAAPGSGASTLVFMPPDTDWAQVESFTVKANGESVVVPGQYLTREQKQRLFSAATRPATRPATQLADPPATLAP